MSSKRLFFWLTLDLLWFACFGVAALGWRSFVAHQGLLATPDEIAAAQIAFAVTGAAGALGALLMQGVIWIVGPASLPESALDRITALESFRHELELIPTRRQNPAMHKLGFAAWLETYANGVNEKWDAVRARIGDLAKAALGTAEPTQKSVEKLLKNLADSPSRAEFEKRAAEMQEHIQREAFRQTNLRLERLEHMLDMDGPPAAVAASAPYGSRMRPRGCPKSDNAIDDERGIVTGTRVLVHKRGDAEPRYMRVIGRMGGLWMLDINGASISALPSEIIEVLS